MEALFLAPPPWEDWSLFGQQIVAGLATGAMYALFALALVLIYRSTDIINFAQSEMAMFGTFCMWSLHLAGLAPWQLILLGVLFGFALGAVVERIVIRPVEDKPHLNVVVVTLGLFLLLNSTAIWIWAKGELPKRFPSPFSFKGVDLGFATIPEHQLGLLVVGLGVMILLALLFSRTKVGLAMRATAQNPLASRLMGINVGRMLTLGWALSAALGGLAGALIAPITFLHPGFMLPIFLYASAAAVLGGLTSAPGAVVGGFIIGVGENLLGTYTPAKWLGPEMKLPIIMLVLVLILLVRPTGLFGERAVRRV
ncbi:MAG: branched-chain amino acid ABC transporter permease [Dehalococcoidia bacterium]|jgi:branched-chain amino acid transport system permease protein|nr:branched-chain amino acid ABC transporter permease [Dehalococcoidia bacterium]